MHGWVSALVRIFATIQCDAQVHLHYNAQTQNGDFAMSDSAAFFVALDARVDSYDLLKHAYYQAWSAGELTQEDLREYASEYWHHVSAFPA